MIDNEPRSILGHLAELKTCLTRSLLFFACSLIPCYFYSEEIYRILLLPLIGLGESQSRELIYTDMTEAFVTYIRVSIFMAILFSVPVLLWNIYKFVAPGFYQKERAVFCCYLIASLSLFLLGVAFAYFYIIPMAWNFFMKFESRGEELSIILMPKVSEYLDLAMKFMIAFGLSFQIPVLLTLLNRVGIIDYRFLIKNRRLAIVIIFILSAIMTPPDVISQFGMAIPMILLYEISIFVCKRCYESVA